MNPVLLYTDTSRIADEQATLNNVVPAYQAIYNAIKAAGVTTVTIAEVDALVQNAKRQSQSNYVNDYVINKLATQAGPVTFGGVAITLAAVKSMIALPDTSAISVALNAVLGGNAQRVFIGNAKAAKLDLLLQLANDVISAVPTAVAQITALYTYYTKTDASTTLANQLQAVCDAMNAFNAANNSLYVNKVPIDERREEQSQSVIPGLAISNNQFVISKWFVQKFEQTGTLNFG